MCDRDCDIRPKVNFLLHCATFTTERQALMNKLHSTKANNLVGTKTSIFLTLLFGKKTFKLT